MAFGVGRSSETRYARTGKWLWAVCIVPGAMLLWLRTDDAGQRHIRDHPEWNQVLSLALAI